MGVETSGGVGEVMVEVVMPVQVVEVVVTVLAVVVYGVGNQLLRTAIHTNLPRIEWLPPRA